MQARIRKSNQIISVELLGKVDYESLEGFIEMCRKELKGKRIVFNLEGLSFVGSCGVTNFLHVLASLQRMPGTEIKYVGMAKEFIKLFQTMEETKDVKLGLHATEFEAVKEYENPSIIEVVATEAATAPHELKEKNLEN